MLICPPPSQIRKSNKIIYELEVFLYPVKAKTYPVATEGIKLGLYSSMEKAEKVMLDSIIPCDKSNKDDDQIHHWSIKEIGLDVQYKDSFYDKRIYSDLGKLRGVIKPPRDPFKGVSADSCCFREGDLVEVLYGGKIVVGVITGLPDSPKVVEEKNAFGKENPLRDLEGNEYSPYCAEGDNAYIVRFNKKEYDYSTFPECLLFKPKMNLPAASSGVS